MRVLLVGLNSRLIRFQQQKLCQGLRAVLSLKEVPAAVSCALHICLSLVCFSFVCQFLSVRELPQVTLSCLFSKERDYCNSNDVVTVSYLLLLIWR